MSQGSVKFFTRKEFICKCGCGKGEAEVQQVLLDSLERARRVSGTPYTITSGYRCPAHNAQEGGVGDSAHTKGLAADIAVTGSAARYAILVGLLTAGFARIGIGKSFIHADADNDKPQEVAWMY